MRKYRKSQSNFVLKKIKENNDVKSVEGDVLTNFIKALLMLKFVKMTMMTLKNIGQSISINVCDCHQGISSSIYYDLLKRIAFCCGEHKMGKEFLELRDVETEKRNFCYSKITIYVGEANMNKVVVSASLLAQKWL